ncbi:DNA-binding domain-containing protein [Asticcacaulis sp. BYS171W]|uniref:DNA-binding domain-containing protein n=1 Tax=Asticcacaulis aquaticus TaxID=2984212 RepID=A0ABT5HXP6_9CAUL|nr:DNA-binding domain-containing protein [Asticcacaulis aquaticus]MDC7684231.1 DNA-binding domain-containing protein [Asticcacaulis aquaticus]
MPEPDLFLDAFAEALSGHDNALLPWWPDRTRGLEGLSVYRNTVAKGLSDALIASYPSVETIVGADWLREAAQVFARDIPPVSGVLVDYGAAFADWLGGFAPASSMPFLPGLARLDRMWTEAHLAADAPAFDPQTLMALSAERFDEVRLSLMPSVRLARFATSLPDLWQALRFQAPADVLELGDAPQSILIWRPFDAVRSRVLCPAASAFLDACHRGDSLAQAAASARTCNPTGDLSACFADLISLNVFTTLIPLEDTHNDRARFV